MPVPDPSTLMPLLKQYLGEMPGSEYNTFGVIASAAPSAVVGVDAMIKSNQAKKQLKTQQGYVDTLMQSYMSKPIYNPYKNMSVATKAAQMKVEETDKALANTLDTLRATGTSAGGATALAQAALQSKLGIAADIEKQEVNNQQLEAKGEFMVQQAEMSRMGEQMDYEQSKADQLRVEQFGYGERAADMAGALGALGLEASRGLSTGKEKDETTIPPITQTGDFNVPADGGLPQLTQPGDDPFANIPLPGDDKYSGSEWDNWDANQNPQTPPGGEYTSGMFEDANALQSGNVSWGTTGLNAMVKERDRLRKAGLDESGIQAIIDATRKKYNLLTLKKRKK